MYISVLTLFPEMFQPLQQLGVVARALQQGVATLELLNPRDFTTDKHRTVDDRPYGGGPGMVMKPEPLLAALQQARKQTQAACVGPSDVQPGGRAGPKTIYLSPQGRPVAQQDIVAASQNAGMIMIAGRYEGIDERLIEQEVDEEWSIGDYVLSGGELAAMVLIDAMVRLLPGALGDDKSAQQDSFMSPPAEQEAGPGLLDCPHYTRPEVFAEQRVPQVLLSGDHAAIAEWREMQRLGRTWRRRPELLAGNKLDARQQALLARYKMEY
ncbi:MAG: tRNA (guanosine(37)-N1)-methyltransferase TrmD [Pseudomonadales bacterium]